MVSLYQARPSRIWQVAVEMSLYALRQLLHARGVVRAGQGFELRTAFPARTLTDHRQSLAASGLTPSATLLVTLTGISASSNMM